MNSSLNQLKKKCCSRRIPEGSLRGWCLGGGSDDLHRLCGHPRPERSAVRRVAQPVGLHALRTQRQTQTCRCV